MSQHCRFNAGNMLNKLLIVVIAQFMLIKSGSCYTLPHTTIKNQRRHFALYDRFGDEDRGISPKVLGTAFILSAGIFGTGFLGNLGNQIQELKQSTVKTETQPKLKGNMENRGSLTSLTRREINTKLQAIPVFFGTIDGVGVYAEDGVGLFFTDAKDAENHFVSSSNKIKVSATSLDDVFYTLIQKKMKIGKFVTGYSANSDASAKYLLKPSIKEYQLTSPKWKESHSMNDIPLYRIPSNIMRIIAYNTSSQKSVIFNCLLFVLFFN